MGFAMGGVVKWLIAGLALAGVLGASYFVHDRMQHNAAPETGVAGAQVQFGIIKLSAKQAERSGIKDCPAEKIMWAERVTVFGQVVPNPSATVDVRALFAGTLRGSPGTPWPAPAELVTSGRLLGRLEIRATPQDRLDWQAKLAEAKQKQHGTEEVVKIQQARIDRLKQFAGAEVVSRRELDEALVQVAEARTQLAIAQATVKLWQDALAGSARPEVDSLWNQPITAPADGEATEIAARPGTSVEAGALLLRLVDFRRPLVRLDLPPSVAMGGLPRQVELQALTTSGALGGVYNQPEVPVMSATLPANLVGIAPQVDTASQLCSCLYEAVRPSADVGRAGPAWRPGLFVKALVTPGHAESRPAVVVPAAALLYHQGRALVYVRIGPGRYERREVRLLGRDADRWVVATGVTVGEPVVYAQAQLLLSQEFNTEADND
ncbi:hypothetical protein AYO44_09920 [Planctomycetaceae bacterium SCGC AG-212-F19]|nr:hypothetical protein AYO44_09920 [Planctomycetaceae bacterium SCGC AG-212-F19]